MCIERKPGASEAAGSSREGEEAEGEAEGRRCGTSRLSEAKLHQTNHYLSQGSQARRSDEMWYFQDMSVLGRSARGEMRQGCHNVQTTEASPEFSKTPKGQDSNWPSSVTLGTKIPSLVLPEYGHSEGREDHPTPECEGAGAEGGPRPVVEEGGVLPPTTTRYLRSRQYHGAAKLPPGRPL